MAVRSLPLSEPDGEDSLVLLDIEAPQPDARFLPGATVNASGWVIAEREITEIAVYLDDEIVTYATYGIQRPEVAVRFPHYPHAEASGFRFSFPLSNNLPTNTTQWVFVSVTTANGTVRRKGLPLKIVEANDLETGQVQPGIPDAGAIKLTVEQARIDSGGLIRINGWVLAVAPLKSLELFLGGTALGAPELGIARPDVATSFPEYGQAATSGFRLVQDVAHLRAERPILRVRASSLGGLTRQSIVPVTFPDRQVRAADRDASIQICVDEASVRSDGSVFVDGWAVSAEGIQEITLLLDGHSIGAAESGRGRADVGNRFPRIPSARQAGFLFNRRLDHEVRGEHVLTLTVRDGGENERTLHLPISVEEVAPVEASASASFDDDEIRYTLDIPALDGDRAQDPVRGALTISGWAISPHGIDTIDVYLEDHKIGRAYYGMRRADIAAAFPRIGEALLSGYATTIPHRLLGNGERAVRLEIKDKAGRVVELAFSIEVSKSEESISTTQLRRTVRLGEIEPFAARLRRDTEPVFWVFVRSKGRSPADRERLRDTLESLRAQAFTSWCAIVIPSELETANSLRSALKATRDSLAGKSQLLVYDGKVPGAMRTWMRSSERHYVASISAGDVLGADAMLQVMRMRAQEGEGDFLYSDDRRLDRASEASGAFFKPDWSPELLLSTNYIGRSWFADYRLAQTAKLDFTDLAESSAYDLVLRLTEVAKTISHIPRVLMDAEQGGADSDDGARSALEAALERRDVKATVVTGRVPGTWRIKRELKTRGRVSFIIPTCGARGLIRKCIETVRAKTHYKNYELVVLDNMPEALVEEKAWVIAHADKVLRIDEKFNWSRFNNLGVAHASGEFLLFLNDDVEIIDGDWLDVLLEEAERPEIGVVGPQLIYPDRKVQHAGMFLSGSHGRHAFRFSDVDDPGYFGLALTARNMISVTGACLLSRREAYDKVGGFDEAHSVVNNDLDYCLRMWRSDLRVVYTPFATLIHHELASRAEILDVFDEERFQGQWGTVFLKGDPFLNPNIATDVEQYAAEAEPAEIVHTGHQQIAFSAVKAILAVKLDHIGDFITALPAFRRLKARFPNSTLTVLASKASQMLATLEPAIDEVLVFDFYHARSALGRKEVSDDELIGLKGLLRERHFDLAVDLRMQGDTRHVLKYSGAPVLAGFDHRGRFPWLDVALEWEGDTSFSPKRTSVVDRLCQLVESIAISFDADRTEMTDVPQAEARERLLVNPVIAALPRQFWDKPLVCVHPAAGNETKQWPEASFAGLIDLLTEEGSVHVVLIGGKDEKPIAERVLEQVQNKASVVSLLGALTLQELPLLIRIAVLFIGNDSGPKHLAAALGTPTVGIHSGVVDTAEWAPFGRYAVAVRRKTICTPCYVATVSDCHRNLECLRKLRPSDVYAACRDMLAIGLQTLD